METNEKEVKRRDGPYYSNGRAPTILWPRIGQILYVTCPIIPLNDYWGSADVEESACRHEASMLSVHKVHLDPLLDEPCRASFNRRTQQQRKASCFNADPTDDPIDPPAGTLHSR